MNMPPTLKRHIANAKVIASILGTLTVLIGAVIAVESRYAHAQKVESAVQELKLAMDETRVRNQLEAEELVLDLNIQRASDSIHDLKTKKIEKGGLDQWERDRLNRLEKLKEQDIKKLERIEQFRLEHKM